MPSSGARATQQQWDEDRPETEGSGLHAAELSRGHAQEEGLGGTGAGRRYVWPAQAASSGDGRRQPPRRDDALARWLDASARHDGWGKAPAVPPSQPRLPGAAARRPSAEARAWLQRLAHSTTEAEWRQAQKDLVCIKPGGLPSGADLSMALRAALRARARGNGSVSDLLVVLQAAQVRP